MLQRYMERGPGELAGRNFQGIAMIWDFLLFGIDQGSCDADVFSWCRSYYASPQQQCALLES